VATLAARAPPRRTSMSNEADKPDPSGHPSVLEILERLTGAAPRVELLDEDSGAPLNPSAPPSRTIPRGRGAYKLMDEIARGGMGVVLRGRDQELRREVAFKVLHPDLAKRADSVQRFVEEAQISGQLQHPGVVPVYELGLLADQRPYFTMKLIRGRTFADLLLEREESTSDRRRMLDIFLSVCQTMAYVHSRGVIHRDLKPANVMVGTFGEVQVVDWGLAKILAPAGGVPNAAPPAPEPEPDLREYAPASARDELTRESAEPVVVDARDSRSLAGSVMGTLSYMPPEQARGEVAALDERADVFALGAILCEILTGGAPYSRSQARASIEASQALLEPAFDELDRSQADLELIEICKQCLSPDRELRPRNAKALVTRLQVYFEGLERRARTAQIEAAEARVKAAEERRARKLTASLAASVVVTLLVLGGGWLWLSAQRERRELATREEVDAALSAAAEAQGASDWAAAQAAVERARTAVQAGAATDSLAARIEQVGAEVARGAEAERLERARRERNAALLARLDEIQSKEGSALNDRRDLEERDREFVAAFREWGVEIDSEPVPSVVERILASGAANELSQGLDQWSWRRVLMARGWTEGARRLVEIANGADPDPERVAIRRALIANDEAKLVELARAAVQTPLRPPTAMSLAAGLLGLQHLDETSRMLEASLEAHPDDFTLHQTLAFTLEDSGPEHFARALVHYTAALALRPTSVNALRGVASLAAARGDVARAQKLYRRALELRPTSYPIWNDLATIVDDPLEQERCLRRALELAPERYEPKINLGRLLHMSGRAEEALPMLREAVEAAPWSYLGWGHLGTALSRTGDRAGAIEAYERAIEANGEDISSLYNLASELRALGRLEEALELSQRAYDLAPSHPLLRFGMGASLLQLGREEQALKHLREALEADPQQSGALALLARMLADAADEGLRDPDAALQAAERALALEPSRLDVGLAKSIAQLRRGDYEAVVETKVVETALRGADNAGVLAQSLEIVRGLALVGLGRREEARALLDGLGAPLADPGDAFGVRERDRLLLELRRALEE
jgi:serine/threonine protein kinase/Tfp pilus assembly protein PilF